MNKDIKLELDAIGKNAKKAANTLSMTCENIKNDALTNMARLIENNSTEILEANKIDMENAEKKVYQTLSWIVYFSIIIAYSQSVMD